MFLLQVADELRTGGHHGWLCAMKSGFFQLLFVVVFFGVVASFMTSGSLGTTEIVTHKDFGKIPK